MERINISDVSRMERDACHFLVKKYGDKEGTLKARRFLKNCERDRRLSDRVDRRFDAAA